MDARNTAVMSATVAVIAIMIGAATLMARSSRRRRRSVWCSPWIMRRESGLGLLSMVHDELVEDKRAFRNFMRMTEEQFKELLSLVRQDISRQDSAMRDCIPPEKRLSLTLRFLATGESFRSLMFSTRIHHSTISQIIPTVCESLYRNLKGRYLKVPQSQLEWEEISEKFDKLWNFPLCLGAMDGKHIAFRAPKEAGSHFFNYKGGHSIVLLAVVDAEYKFIFVDVGVNGRVSDGGVYRESKLSEAILNNTLNFPPPKKLSHSTVDLPYVLVADDAFPLTNRIMKPYPNRNLSEEERLFNYRLSRARRVVENAFGILSNRFRVFLAPINLSPTKVDTIVLACVALHNFLCQKNGRHYTSTVGEDSRCTLLELSQQSGNRSSASAQKIREEFKKYFNS